MRKLFKNNKKGVSGIDISIAIIVVTIGLSLITSLIISTNKTAKKVNREIQATQIAKEIFEKIKLVPYEDFLNIIKESSNEHYETSFGIIIPAGYTVDIEVENKTAENLGEAILYNIRRKGDIKVVYWSEKQQAEVKIPFTKYFDKLIPKNEPDLNSAVIESDKSYSQFTVFEPGYGIRDDFVLADNIEDWKSYRIKQQYFANKIARRKNTLGETDYFIWEPRYVTVSNENKNLLGRTMYSLEPYMKNIEYPIGTNIILNLTKVEEQIGTPIAGTEEGRWVKIDI